MAGITSIGVYVPMYRLNRDEIGKMWRTKGTGGEKAVAGYDEDPLTMAVAAAQICLRRGSNVTGLYLASTTAPYREKQNAAIVAGAVDLPKTCVTADFGSSLRAGATAMKLAFDATRENSTDEIMVIASDCRMGAPAGRFEQLFGDAAVAVTIGSNDMIAEIEDFYSVFNDFTDEWRTASDPFVRSGEARFVDEAGYLPTLGEAIGELMRRRSLEPGDFSKIVFSAVDGRLHGQLAKKLGFGPAQIQDHLFTRIGNSGTAAPFVMLASALEQAKPGDRILFAAYGDGAGAFVLRVTDGIGKGGVVSPLESAAETRSIEYGTYLTWRDLVPFEPSSLPDRAEPSLATRWRERRSVSPLYGVKCRKCGTPQIHPTGQAIRVCAACQGKDDFDPYRFSDKRGRLFTYAVDQLQPTKNPPGLNGVVDFDGGGRLICELTDYDLGKAAIGMPVEMTFRLLSHGKGIVNYFWKAKPAREHT
jgi:hydroxymethylglutaryl-CoA synthase